MCVREQRQARQCQRCQRCGGRGVGDGREVGRREGGAPDTELRARPGNELAAASTSFISSASTSSASGITSSGGGSGGVPVPSDSRVDETGACVAAAATWRAGERDGSVSQGSSASISHVGAAAPVTNGASSRSHLHNTCRTHVSREPSHRRGLTRRMHHHRTFGPTRSVESDRAHAPRV